MTFLAPWALAVGALAAAGAILLHLVARQRPAAVLLPTARFIADRRSLVSTVVRRPRDLVLLALRVVTLLAAAAAFARPVLAPTRSPIARVVLLDRSAAVASPADAVSRVRTLLDAAAPMRLIAFDSTAVALPFTTATLDSIAGAPVAGGVGSITAALVAARRAAALLAAHADSVQVVLVSPVVASEVDDATSLVRAQWPGALSLVRVAARIDSTSSWSLERAIPIDDPRGPAASALRVAAGRRAVRVRTSSLDAPDSAFARGGGTVVEWNESSAGPMAPAALVVGDDVVVAMLGRSLLPAGGRTVARWANGSAAAREILIGYGCIRTVAVGLPTTGDLPLRHSFQRAVRGLLAPCGSGSSGVLADAATVARLRGSGPMARGSALATGGDRPTPLVPWLLALAAVSALAELFVRARPAPEAA
ncbi:MAG TPA: BatA domain-containing protein [Gemmatimonadaceae bacterium]